MKIAHLCLSNWYIDNFGYQENEIVRAHVEDGHEVLIIASTEIVDRQGKLAYVQPSSYLSSEGASVVRLPYRRFAPHYLMTKLRIHPSVYLHLTNFKPDVILFHGTCGWEILSAAAYVNKHSNCKLFVDSHEDWNNSARTYWSKVLLHKLYYGSLLRIALPNVEKILCYSTESLDFVEKVYRIPSNALELYPLGGRPISDLDYHEKRCRVRKELGFSDSHIVFIQSGKQTARKKLVDTLHHFLAVKSSANRLIIVGSLDSSIKSQVLSLINTDDRCCYLGWASFDRLTDLLCAADVYVQPGTQSATMQHSLCCRCAIAIDDVYAHHFYLCNNGWLLNNKYDLSLIFSQAANSNLLKMQENSYLFAQKNLDYKILSKRVIKEENSSDKISNLQ